MSWWSRVANLMRSDRLDRDLADEQRFHIEARAADLEAAGMSRQAALAQAARQFGPPLRLRETSRDVKLLPWLESLLQDARFGIRVLRRDSVVSLAAVVSLGLAIGACTAAFSLIDAVMLRPLPVRDPARLVYLRGSQPGSDERQFSALFSYPFYERIKQNTAAYMESFSMSQQSLRQALLPDASGVEEKLRTQYVSGNAFAALGVTAATGRVLLPADDLTPGGHAVAVVSHAFWTRRFDGRPDVVGQWLQVEQRAFQIVGVTQRGFTGAQAGAPTDIWLPNMMFPNEPFRAAQWNWLQIWGRLSPGVAREALGPIVGTTITNFEPAQRRGGQPLLEVVDATTGFSEVRREFERPLLALAAIVGAVLLIACSNVANLLLARGAARRRDMALRASIGAGRRRLLQQVVVESCVLTAAAIVLGVLCAAGAVPLIIGLLSTNENPVYLDTSLDWRAVAFVAALGGATTALFGLVPALRASAVLPAEATTLDNRRATQSAGMAGSLVAVQVGFSLMLLFVAALLLRSYDRLLAIDLGFTPGRLALLSIETRDRLEPAAGREIGRQLLERVSAMDRVESASLSSWALFRGWASGNSVEVPGRGSADSFRLAVSHGFFRSMGTQVLEGREFAPRDNEATDPVPVIVNEVFARRYFPGESAVGRRVFGRNRSGSIPYEIVGVVANTRDRAVRGEPPAFMFSPIAEAAGTLQIRSSEPAQVLAARLHRELAGIHPSLRLVDVTTQSALVGNTLLRERMLAVLSAFFAVVGLVLAAVGLYGVLSYSVVRRTREIGIRVTLGARPAAIVRSICGRVTVSVGCGVAAGLAAGAYFVRFVRTFLYEVEPSDAASFALPVLCLLAVAVVAAWLPARRAVRIDPAGALRME